MEEKQEAAAAAARIIAVDDEEEEVGTAFAYRLLRVPYRLPRVTTVGGALLDLRTQSAAHHQQHLVNNNSKRSDERTEVRIAQLLLARSCVSRL